MPFAPKWIDVEIIIRNKVSQRKIHGITYVKSGKKVQMKPQTQKTNLRLTKGKWGGEG